MKYTDAERAELATQIVRERRRIHGTIENAIRVAGVNRQTWERAEAGLRVWDSKLHAILRAVGLAGPAELEPDATQTADTLADRLAVTAANLDAYIDRRAAELAQPLIEQVRAEADARVLDAQLKTRRAEDLAAELRRQLQVLDRQARRATELEDELIQLRRRTAGSEVPR